MTGRLAPVKLEPACPAAAGAEFDQIQLTGQDITDSAGVPKGSFYNHFDSKEALAVVALQRYAERRRLEDLADPSAAPLARLRSHFELLRAETQEHGFTRGCLLGNLGAEVADHSDVLRAAVGQSLARWAELIHPGAGRSPARRLATPTARSAGHSAVCSQRLGRHADLGPG